MQLPIDSLAPSAGISVKQYKTLQEAANLKSWELVKHRMPAVADFIKRRKLLNSLGLHNEHGIDILEIPPLFEFDPKVKEILNFYNIDDLPQKLFEHIKLHNDKLIFASTKCKIYPNEYYGAFKSQGKKFDVYKLKTLSQSFGLCTDLSSAFYSSLIGYDYDILFDELIAICQNIFFNETHLKDRVQIASFFGHSKPVDEDLWEDSILEKIVDLKPDYYVLRQLGELSPHSFDGDNFCFQ